jgi:hypothetical protein
LQNPSGPSAVGRCRLEANCDAFVICDALSRKRAGHEDWPRHSWQKRHRTTAFGGIDSGISRRILHIGPATVKAHLSHIYAKVGVANRTELATVAASAPLTDNIRST